MFIKVFKSSFDPHFYPINFIRLSCLNYSSHFGKEEKINDVGLRIETVSLIHTRSVNHTSLLVIVKIIVF